MLEQAKTDEPSPESVSMANYARVPITALRPSATQVQKDRRERFTSAALKELAETVRQVGVIEPIIVRPCFAEESRPQLEIVAGERRWLAAQAASLQEVPVIVRNLTDEQALLLQLAENIQREQLHPMTEATGFEELVKHHGYNVKRLAAELASGKGTAYVAGRLKLLSLCAKARDAFAKGHLSTAAAFLLARVPTEALQLQALKEITRKQNGQEPMSDREVVKHLNAHYTLRLSEASFPKDDPELVPAAGPCGSCPKRTGNQPELFADVQGADTCTDLGCFQAKRVAWGARQLSAAKTAGKTVIDGDRAKKIAPYGVHNLQGYVLPSDRCYDDTKNRTFRQLAGDKAQTALLVVPDTGEVVEVFDRKALDPVLQARGVGADRKQVNESEKAQRLKLRKESAFRWRLFEAVRLKGPASLARQDLEQLALTTFGRHGFEARKRILKVWNWTAKDGKAYDTLSHDKAAAKRIPELTDAELARFLLDCVYVSDLQVSAWIQDKPERLLAAAKRTHIDVDSLRKEPTTTLPFKGERKPVKGAVSARPWQRVQAKRRAS